MCATFALYHAVDESYDVALCTQVLEHVPDPLAVLGELRRILKPGGTLYLSAPFFFAEHMQPYDYYRYTQFGLRWLLEQAGFEVCKVERLEGYLGALAYQMGLAARHLPLRPSREGGAAAWLVAGAAVLLKPLFLLLFLFFDWAERRYKVERSLCKNYVVVAVKPLRA